MNMTTAMLSLLATGLTTLLLLGFLYPLSVAAGEGWYLLAPPDITTTDAPLRTWTRARAYDTAADCSRGRAAMVREAEDELVRKNEVMQARRDRGEPIGEDDAEWLAFTRLMARVVPLSFSQCVAVSDPALR